MLFDNEGNIRIRQSWLDDAMKCPERGRLGIVAADWNGPSDATALGTGAHAAVEAHIEQGDTPSNYAELIAAAIDSEIVLPNMRWNKYDDRDELVERAINCYKAWRADIWPTMPQGGHPEVQFEYHLGHTHDGRAVYFVGTVDYVPPTGDILWDWKFPGRAYNQKSKQKEAIQPTVYCAAAVAGAFSHVREEPFNWPMTFRYGIGHTGGANRQAKAQVFDVTRTQAHLNWAIERAMSFVHLALNSGTEAPWPQNDSHWLCSDKWCPWWARCKGAHMTWRDDLPPT